MAQYLASSGVSDAPGQPPLAQGLAALLQAPLRSTADGVVLDSLASPGLRACDFPDTTGLEALRSKIHIEDFAGGLSLVDTVAQGLLYAEQLAKKLEVLSGEFRVVLTLNIECADVVVRFHGVRAGELWCFHDPSELTTEGVALWETGKAQPE